MSDPFETLQANIGSARPDIIVCVYAITQFHSVI